MKKIEIIGHRGARAYAPENVIAGYKIALEQGIDYIDVDVVVTKDRQLIGYHNLLLNPDITCNSNGTLISQNNDTLLQGLIKNMNQLELQQNYMIRLNPNSLYAKLFPKQQQVPNTHINSLQEIVDFINQYSINIGIQIEIKNDFEHLQWSYSFNELANILYDFISKNNLINRVKVQAFDWRILVFLNQHDIRIKTAYLVSYDLKDNWYNWFANSMIMGIASKVKVDNPHFLIHLIKELGGYSYEPEDNELTYAELELAHNLGLKVYVWGWVEHSGFVYNKNLMAKLIGWGIDGIITDDPKQLNEQLHNMGYKHIPYSHN